MTLTAWHSYDPATAFFLQVAYLDCACCSDCYTNVIIDGFSCKPLFHGWFLLVSFLVGCHGLHSSLLSSMECSLVLCLTLGLVPFKMRDITRLEPSGDPFTPALRFLTSGMWTGSWRVEVAYACTQDEFTWNIYLRVSDVLVPGQRIMADSTSVSAVILNQSCSSWISLCNTEAQVKHRVSFCVASAWYTLMILECRSGYLVLRA